MRYLSHEISRDFFCRRGCSCRGPAPDLWETVDGLIAGFRQKPADFVHDQGMEVTLATFGALMREGKISLAAYEGQLVYGKALMNEAGRVMRSEEHRLALGTLQQKS